MQLRLLVIDDDDVDRAIVRRALSAARLDFELVEAKDAKSGIEAARASTFDCVLLDYRLPGSSGRDVLDALRAAGLTTPIVMLTGHGDEALAVELMKAGASDYVSKGALTAERLALAIRQVLQVHRVEEEKRAALRAHTARLKALAEAAIAMNTVLSAQAVSECVAERAAALMKAEKAVARLLPSAGDEPLAAAIDAMAGPLRAAGDGLGGSAPLAALVAVGFPAPTRSWLATPLVGRHGAPIGVLHVVDSASAFDEDDEAILVQLGHMASIAIENAWLYEAANAAIKARDDLLAIVSHDLRNPLNTVMMGASLLERSGSMPPTDATNVSRIKRAASRMTGLVSDLLDVSKIEAGTLAIGPEPLELGAVLEEAIDLLRPAAADKRIALAVDVAAGLPLVAADQHRLLQVLSNLLGNALKFTPSGGKIDVTAAPHADGVVVRVADTGTGIDADHLPRVFDRFWQASGKSGHGAGLGLFITKGIVEAHGGRITVESKTGIGTTFAFTLPSAKSDGGTV